MKTWKKFATKEISEIEQLYKQGVPVSEMATKLNRSRQAIYDLAKRLKISTPHGIGGKGNGDKPGDKPEDIAEVPIVLFDRGDGDKASSSPRVKDTPPARNIKGSLFKVRMRGIDLEVTVEELLDIMELYWAFREEGYVGSPLALAKRCMVKMANLTDIKPKLYLEVLNG